MLRTFFERIHKSALKRNRHKKPLIRNIIFSSASHHAHTLGVNLFGSAEILYRSFAYLMNNQINGHYAEFGVYKGGTTLEAISASKVFGQEKMNFHIFDSFEGLPELRASDLDRIFVAGEFSNDLNSFKTNLEKEKVDMSRIIIHPGFYESTLSSLNLDVKFSFVLIDCDLYSSTVPVLDFISNKLMQGSIIAFDDWYCYDSPAKGERRAVQEWLVRKPNIQLLDYHNFHWAGKSFIVNLK